MTTPVQPLDLTHIRGVHGETDAAIDVVAHDALGKRQRDLLWEDYPEIGERDWAAVVERVDQISEGLTPDPHELQQAMALLASRAEDEEVWD